MQRLLALALLAASLGARGYLAADEDYVVLISGFQFNPGTVVVRSGEPIRIHFENRDGEKVTVSGKGLGKVSVPAKGAARLELGTLAPGPYPFVLEGRPATTPGTVYARPEGSTAR